MVTKIKDFTYLKYIFFILLFFLFWHISTTVPKNSDNVIVFLEAHAILHGNIFLHNFFLSPDNWLTGDTLFYILFEFLFGFHFWITSLIPAFIFSAIIFVSFHLMNKKNRWLSLSILIFISPFISKIILVSAIHMVTYLFILLSVWLYQEKIKFNFLIICFLLFLACFSDPFVVVSGFFPFIVFLLYSIFIQKEKSNLKTNILKIVFLFLSFLSATVLSHLFHYFGFSIDSISVKFSDLNQTIINFHLFPKCVWLLFNSFLLLKHASLFHFFYVSIHFLGFLLVGYAFIYHSFNLKKIDFIQFFSFFAIVGLLFCFLFSNLPVNLASTRYLIAVLPFSTILLSYTPILFLKKHKLTTIICFLYFISFIPQFFYPIQTYLTSQKVIHFLEKHQLKYGYTSYWNATFLQSLSNGKVITAPVIDYNHRLYPFLWISNRSWYFNSLPHFFVILDKKDTSREIFYKNALRTFGPPSSVKFIDFQEILIWNHSIQWSKETNLLLDSGY